MKDKLTIIISDVKGSKHYTVNQIIKKVILYIVLFILTLFFIGLIWIKFLLNQVEEIERKKASYKKEAQELFSKNEKLIKKIGLLQSEIKTKTDKLEEINDRISELEENMGLKRDINSSININLDLFKLTPLQGKMLLKNIPNGYPVVYNGITSKFGWRINPIKKTKEFHPGLDLRAKMGEKIVAPADGIVEFAGYSKRSGYGNLIILDHNFGFKSFFGHLKKVAVKNGDFVKKGDVIGYVGNTGLSTGHHLHYAVMYLQRFLNPYYFIKWDHQNFDYIFKKERRVKWQSLIQAIQSQILLLSHRAQK